MTVLDKCNLSIDYHHNELDARGFDCPIPILKAKKLLFSMQSGEILKIYISNEDTLKDFKAFCMKTKNTFLSSYAYTNESFVVFLQRR